MANNKDDEDVDFLNYIRARMLRAPVKVRKIPPPLVGKARKIGREKPKYCELHEAFYLNPRRDGIVHADHNHESGKYRGWICRTCNTQLIPEIDRLKVIGVEKDDIKAFLNLLVEYVFTDGKVLNGRLDNT